MSSKRNYLQDNTNQQQHHCGYITSRILKCLFLSLFTGVLYYTGEGALLPGSDTRRRIVQFPGSKPINYIESHFVHSRKKLVPSWLHRASIIFSTLITN